MIYLPRTSREMVYIPGVRAFSSDSGEPDVTTLPVDVAIIPDTMLPEDSDWVEAEWTPAATSPTARILVGPGGTIDDLAPNVWLGIWLRVRGTVEEPERKVGSLKLT